MPISIDNSNYIKDEYGRINHNASNSTDHVRNDHYTSGRDSLSAGQTITGEIIEKDGDQVTIRMSNDQTISAKLSGNANIEVGMKLTFEVAKGPNDQTALRPLFSNLANSSAAMSALKAAGLPVNNTTLAMTDRMMTESMPVNKNALTAMFRNISAHQSASPESIVQMTKLNMPLTESNVIQFENYRNFEHRITNDLQQVSDGIADLFKEAATLASGDNQNAQSIGGMTAGEVMSEILDLIDTENLDTIMPEKAVGVPAEAAGSAGQVAAEEMPASAGAKNVAATDVLAQEKAVENASGQVPEHASSVLKNTVDGFISGIKDMFVQDTGADQTTDNGASFNTNLSLTSSEQVTLSNDLQNILILAGESADIHEPLDPSQVMSAVKELLNEYPPEDVRVVETELGAYSEQSAEAGDEIKLQNAAQSDIDALRTQGTGSEGQNANVATETGIADQINANTAQVTAESVKAKISEKLNELLRSDGFTKLVKDSVKAQMSIKPQDVAQNGKIEELYENIRKTSVKINQLMESIGRADSPISQAANALNDNVNFMNQLSEFVNYVQLPLKMAGEDANGELYVYTNKKNLSDKDGNYSALLHLDMEHLGPMDVYVTMRDHTKVNTNFYLQTEELLDFIASHIDELTDRLTQKGYVANTKVTRKDPGKPITPIADEFTKDEGHEETHTVVTRMRFDVRA